MMPGVAWRIPFRMSRMLRMFEDGGCCRCSKMSRMVGGVQGVADVGDV